MEPRIYVSARACPSGCVALAEDTEGVRDRGAEGDLQVREISSRSSYLHLSMSMSMLLVNPVIKGHSGQRCQHIQCDITVDTFLATCIIKSWISVMAVGTPISRFL